MDTATKTKAKKFHRTPNGFWQDKKNVIANARKFKTKHEWRVNSQLAYNVANIMGYMKEATAHMDKNRKSTKVPEGFWDIKENVFADRKKYKTKKSWRIKSMVAYQKASNNGWLDEIA